MIQSGKLPVGSTLSEGWRLFGAGLFRAFPWILAAELLPVLEPAGAAKNILTSDLGQFFSLPHLGLALFIGCLQAWLYGIAIIQLAGLAGQEMNSAMRTATRSILPLLIGYLIYEAIVFLGMGFALILFLPTAMIVGLPAGVLVTLIPLAPTAYVSTALALFAFPAVLEKKGPLAALVRSVQLTRSNWGRSAVVISVPAIVLLAITAVKEIPFIEGLRASLRQIAGNTSTMGLQQLEKLLTNQSSAGAAAHSAWWTTLFVVLTAVGWWYTLVVCYAEYRDLAGRAAH